MRLPQPEISFSPAGSCLLQIVKGQQAPWKDKPGKTAQQVQAPLKAYSRAFIIITSSNTFNNRLRVALRCFTNVKCHYGLSVLAEQHAGTTPTPQCGPGLHSFVLKCILSHSARGLPSQNREKAATSCTPGFPLTWSFTNEALRKLLCTSSSSRVRANIND